MKKIPPHLPLFLALFLAGAGTGVEAGHDYRDALLKAILFFEGQRSGFLSEDQRMTWRGHSGLGDGWTHRTDLTGGYYDAGDNVKFGFPMAFTATMMAWSVIEFGEEMPRNELRNALVAIHWATDYLLKQRNTTESEQRNKTNGEQRRRRDEDDNDTKTKVNLRNSNAD